LVVHTIDPMWIGLRSRNWHIHEAMPPARRRRIGDVQAVRHSSSFPPLRAPPHQSVGWGPNCYSPSASSQSRSTGMAVAPLGQIVIVRIRDSWHRLRTRKPSSVNSAVYLLVLILVLS